MPSLAVLTGYLVLPYICVFVNYLRISFYHSIQFGFGVLTGYPGLIIFQTKEESRIYGLLGEKV